MQRGGPSPWGTSSPPLASWTHIFPYYLFYLFWKFMVVVLGKIGWFSNKQKCFQMLQISCIPYTIGWIITIYSTNVWWIYLSRLFVGRVFDRIFKEPFGRERLMCWLTIVIWFLTCLTICQKNNFSSVEKNTFMHENTIFHRLFFKKKGCRELCMKVLAMLYS